ncbi:hypothetical protein EDB92DRAFT_1939458 [Lactarius akahatsu]|uniref:Methyltransferase-like protein n=1 Tax=Lactarius akahatsu TaxID=416441 RepID=A0AAD4LRC6_9AGAM|nr:hypothetical protein EDB92DRAFT_1939458 [Lactarius akahatsu]
MYKADRHMYKADHHTYKANLLLNASDHVPSPPDQHATIAASLPRQRAAPVPQPDKQKYNAKPAKHWFVICHPCALYTSPPCGTITASVLDLSSASSPPDLAPRSADILVLLFVLSALHPSEWPQAIISNIAQMVKPGGLVLMRDYGRYDLTQLRFKAGRFLDDNFHIRSNNTRVYFFELGLVTVSSSSPLRH